MTRRATPWDAPIPRGYAFQVNGEIVPYVRVGQERTTDRAQRYFAWKKAFGYALRSDANGYPDLPWTEGAIEVGVTVYRYSQRGDADNCAKACMDAANGILWHDDAQVVKVRAQLVPVRKGDDAVVIDITPRAEYAARLVESRR